MSTLREAIVGALMDWRADIILGLVVLCLTLSAVVAGAINETFHFSTRVKVISVLNLGVSVVAIATGIHHYRLELRRARSKIPEGIR